MTRRRPGSTLIFAHPGAVILKPRNHKIRLTTMKNAPPVSPKEARSLYEFHRNSSQNSSKSSEVSVAT